MYTEVVNYQTQIGCHGDEAQSHQPTDISWGISTRESFLKYLKAFVLLPLSQLSLPLVLHKCSLLVSDIPQSLC